MSLPIQPSPRSSGPRYSRPRGPSVFSLIRERGTHGMVVAVVFMALGISPTLLLLWSEEDAIIAAVADHGCQMWLRMSRWARVNEILEPRERSLAYSVGKRLRDGALPTICPRSRS